LLWAAGDDSRRRWEPRKNRADDSPLPQLAPLVGRGVVALDGGRRLAVLTEIPGLPTWLRWLPSRWTSLFIGPEPRCDIRVFDAATGRTLRQFIVSGRRSQFWPTLDPSGRYLAVTNDDGTVRVYDLPPARPWPLIAGLVTLQGLL